MDKTLLELSTKELVFQGRCTEPNSTTLKLTNPTNHPIHFKVKTTAPKDYAVKPNVKTVQPGETASVEIMLKAMDFDPLKVYKHQFMIQQTSLPWDRERNEKLEVFFRGLAADDFQTQDIKVKLDLLSRKTLMMEMESDELNRAVRMMQEGTKVNEMLQAEVAQLKGIVNAYELAAQNVTTSDGKGFAFWICLYTLVFIFLVAGGHFEKQYGFYSYVMNLCISALNRMGM